jgi:predicted MPP superfamily phosphohydrolase
MREQFIFRHFFDGLAVGGALAEWAIACWLLAGRGITPPPALHVAVPVVLAVMNRLAANGAEGKILCGPLSGRGGYLVLAFAFGGVVCAAALGVTAGAWAGLRVLGGFQAEAGTVAAGTSEALFGHGFRLLGSLALAASALAVAYGYAHGHRRLVVTRIEVPLAGLPPALAGLRLVHVSDLHMGPMADRAALRDALAQVAALDPDVVCITGDIIDSPATDLASWTPELRSLGARHGVFAVLGNHDRQVGADRVAAALERWSGCRLLRDQAATLTVDGVRLHLIGLEDRAGDAPPAALHTLLAQVPAGEPVVLLAHHPDLFPAAAAAGVSVMLAGHTHGGQMAVPGLPRLNPARLFVSRYDAGTHERDGTVLHVNRGLGTSGQRVRVGAPREITVVTLVGAAAHAA